MIDGLPELIAIWCNNIHLDHQYPDQSHSTPSDENTKLTHNATKTIWDNEPYDHYPSSPFQTILQSWLKIQMEREKIDTYLDRIGCLHEVGDLLW